MCSPPGLPSPSRYVGWGCALTWQPRLSPGQGTSMGTHGGQTPTEDKHPQKGQEAPQENKTGSRWTGGLEISNGVARGWRRRPKRLVGAGGDLVSLWGKVSVGSASRGGATSPHPPRSSEQTGNACLLYSRAHCQAGLFHVLGGCNNIC